MRIAVVLNASWNIVNFRLGLMRALASDGHTVIAIAPRDRFSERIPFEYHELRMRPDGVNPAQELALLLRLVRLYRKVRPDVVLHFTPKPNIYGSLAARLLGIPAVSNIAGLGSMFGRRKLVRAFFKALYRLALHANARVFFQNAEDREHFRRERLAPPGRDALLPGSGVDLARFAPRPGAPAEATRFLLVGRLLWEKGVGDFAEAARRARGAGIPARFQIAGFLDARNPGAVPGEEVEGWVREGVLEYLGPKDDVREAVACADCIVFPSFYREGVPRTLLEASAMAKPIIAYDNVGSRDVVEHGRTGLLVPSRDVAALVDAIAAVVEMPARQREEMGRLGRAKVEREFDEALVVEAYRSALGEIAASREGGHAPPGG